MRGLEKFLLGIFLPVGVLLLFTAISALINQPRLLPVFDNASAAACSEVGKQRTATCTTTCNGKSVSGTEVFECQSDLQEYSDGRCYATECTNTSGAKTTSTTTTQTSSGGNCGALEVGCHLGKVAGFFTTGLGDLVKNIITFVLQTLGQAIGGNSKTTAYLDPPKTTAEAYERFGALGAIGLTVDDMYANPPLSTVDYLATINPIIPIFAQDPNKTPGGNDILSASGPIGLFWKASRNLAYIAFVLILVTIGFMLMFRSKLDPRTTVTVTAALPNLVVSMVLITFSLAFAVLLVDAGKLLEEVVKAVINGSLTNNDALVRADRQIGLSVGNIWRAFVFDNSNSLSLGNGSELVSAFVNLIILIFGFFVGLQVFIMLLTRYVSILVKPIFAPLTFLIGALPGKGHVAGAWFKGYLVDVLTFPVVLFILNLASSVKYGAALSTQGDPFGLLAPGSNLAGLAALGILIFATKVPAMLEDALDAHPSKTVAGAGLQAKDVTKQIPIVKNLL